MGYRSQVTLALKPKAAALFSTVRARGGELPEAVHTAIVRDERRWEQGGGRQPNEGPTRAVLPTVRQQMSSIINT